MNTAMIELSPEEWTAIRLSLRIATTATIASLPFGIFAAYALARWRFPGKMVLDGLIHLPLVLPPVVTGYMLLIILGRRGVLGAPLAEYPVSYTHLVHTDVKSAPRRIAFSHHARSSVDVDSCMCEYSCTAIECALTFVNAYAGCG